jgi:DNA-directed RNA polymerase subunit L
MKIEVLENEDEKLKILVHTNLTLINLLNEKIWKQRVEMTAYKKEHPYLSQPILMVKGKNPKKAVLDAADEMIEDIKEFRKHFQHAVK